MSTPVGLRPETVAGVRLADLVGLMDARPTITGPVGPDRTVTGVTLRAQDVRPGDLFAALPGSNIHGARHAGQAIERGAIAILTDPAGAELIGAGDPSVAILVHPDPRSVLGGLAAAVYGHPSRRMLVVGITGTSGKTTVSYLVESALRHSGRRAGLVGTIGIRIDGEDVPSALTTPEAPALQALLAAMAERGIDTVVMEVSSHALSLGRVDGIQFEVAGFTNLSRDHLDFHPNMADYFDAKALLFDPASPCHAHRSVICIDDDAGRAMADRAENPVTVSANGHPAAWRAVEVVALVAAGQEFTVVDPAGGRHRIGIGLPGRYNVANCLVALAILDVLGVSPGDCAAGLRATRVPGRLEAVDCGQGFLALVDYAHKPEALRAVLSTLREPGRRLAVVFGAGGDRDAGKRSQMGVIAAELADFVVVTDDNPRSEDPAAIRAQVLADIRGTSARVVEIGDRRAAIRAAVDWAQPGDVVLIAGKGHETGQSSAGVVHPFDDRDELEAALSARADGGDRL